MVVSYAASWLTVAYHSDECMQHRVLRIDFDRSLKVILSHRELLLSIVYHAEAVPRIVVAVVGTQRIAERARSLLELVVGHVLVARECVRVRKVRIELDRATKQLERRLVLLLETEAVADHAPGFGCQAIKLDHGLRQRTQGNILRSRGRQSVSHKQRANQPTQGEREREYCRSRDTYAVKVPQDRAVDLHSFDAVRLTGAYNLEQLSCLVVERQLEQCTSLTNKHPACGIVSAVKLFDLRTDTQRLVASIPTVRWGRKCACESRELSGIAVDLESTMRKCWGSYRLRWFCKVPRRRKEFKSAMAAICHRGSCSPTPDGIVTPCTPVEVSTAGDSSNSDVVGYADRNSVSKW